MSHSQLEIDSLLQPFQKFGVHLGLERIHRLLAKLGDPHLQVPIIHVAGTNGKGSVCAYLSAVLTQAGYRTGRYTSPHLVHWTERFCMNEEPIAVEMLIQLLREVIAAISEEEESPTQFEVITAAAWLYFAQQNCDLAVMEVGLGGRLDATNVCSNPLVTVITSISREHWQVLGSTLGEIAAEKAGILKPGCPAVVGQLPPEAEQVVRQRIAALDCPAIFPEKAIALQPGWARYQNLSYPLPLLGEFQLMNSALAVATLQLLQQQGWKIPLDTLQQGMAKAKWLGRLQWTTWKGYKLLIDGAHNPAAAQELRKFVDTLIPTHPVTWVMGILSTKDHVEILQALLRTGDRLYLAPVPDPSSTPPQQLAEIALKVCPHLEFCQAYSELELGLEAAFQDAKKLTVLCGSLYLIGDFLSKNQEL